MFKNRTEKPVALDYDSPQNREIFQQKHGTDMAI